MVHVRIVGASVTLRKENIVASRLVPRRLARALHLVERLILILAR
jgi:hypothetical protein